MHIARILVIIWSVLAYPDEMIQQSVVFLNDRSEIARRGKKNVPVVGGGGQHLRVRWDRSTKFSRRSVCEEVGFTAQILQSAPHTSSVTCGSYERWRRGVLWGHIIASRSLVSPASQLVD